MPTPVRSVPLVGGLVGALLAGSGAATLPAHADPGEPTAEPYLQLQARTNLLVNDEGYHLPPGSSFNSISPDIDDAGRVAFKVQLVRHKDGSYRPGLWVGGDGEGGIVHEGSPGDAFYDDVSLADTGLLAFSVAPGGGFDSELWTYDTATGATDHRYSLPVTPTAHSSPTLADDGDVTTRATLGSGRGWVTSAPDDTGTLVAAENTVSPSPYHYLYSPTANDAGQVAGKIGTDATDTAPVEIRRFEPGGGSTRLLANTAADPTSAYSRFDNSVAMNDEGVVAVVATRAADGAEVLLSLDDGSVTEVVVAGEDAVTAFDSFPPDVNDEGQIVFRGVDADGQAVYVAEPDGTLTRVVGAGSPVDTDLGEGQVAQHDGSPVLGGAPAINDGGDVVFTAALTPAGDRTVEWGTGVFVAHAGEVAPEQGTLQGAVTDAADGSPLAGAEVQIAGAGTPVSVTSDASGEWTRVLDPGSYQVTTTLEGYETRVQDVTVEPGGQAGVVTELSAVPAPTLSPGSLTLAPGLWRDDRGEITLHNPGSGPVDWRLDGDAGWLGVSPASGTLPAGGSTTVAVRADRSALRHGRYTAGVRLLDGEEVLGTTRVAMVVRRADVAVNVGGRRHRDGARTWYADRRFRPGHDLGRLGPARRATTRHRIAATRQDTLFQSRRVGRVGYRVTGLAPGRYRVSLGFAEHSRVARGRRVMRVLVDGRTAIRRYDVAARHPRPFRAVWRSVVVRHRRGAMNVTVRGIRGRPVLSALRITETR